MRTIRVGSGAGYSGDRIEPAVELAEKGGLDYLVFECLAERTIALAQQIKMKDPNAGYDPLLAARMRAVLPICAKNKVKIVTNMGAANPTAAAKAARDIARELGLKGLKVAAVTGDDVFAYLHDHDVALDNGKTIAAMGNRVISANAYIGVAPIVEALKGGANVVITGRAADPAIFMAPLIVEFGWGLDDWTRLGRGVLVGHLLECAGQVTGGYFADPGVKDVVRSRPARLSDWRSPRGRRARGDQGRGFGRRGDRANCEGAACSTRSTIPRPIFSRTSSPTSRMFVSRRSGRTACA